VSWQRLGTLRLATFATEQTETAFAA
jgi:hypothetical protein